MPSERLTSALKARLQDKRVKAPKYCGKIILQLEWKNPKALKSFGDYLGEHPYFTVEKSEFTEII